MLPSQENMFPIISDMPCHQCEKEQHCTTNCAVWEEWVRQSWRTLREFYLGGKKECM